MSLTLKKGHPLPIACLSMLALSSLSTCCGFNLPTAIDSFPSTMHPSVRNQNPALGLQQHAFIPTTLQKNQARSFSSSSWRDSKRSCCSSNGVRRPPPQRQLARTLPSSSLRMTASQDQGETVDTSSYDEREKKIQLMVYMLARMGGDLSALGPDGDEIGGLDELFKQVQKMQRQVEEAKEASISRQLLDIAPDMSSKAKAKNLKLQIGCGKNTLKGWLNLDLHGWRLDEGGPSWAQNRGKERVMSVNAATTPLPFPDQSCAAVYCAHMLEHLSHPAETLLFLREVRRVLAPGAVVRLVVPDAEQWLNAYVQKDEAFFEAVQREWSFWDWPSLSPSKGSITGGHQFGFDEGSLTQLLVKAGFDQGSIRRCSYQGSPREELRVDEISSAAAAAWYNGSETDNKCRHFSLFVEAERGEERERPREQQLNFLQRMLRKE